MKKYMIIKETLSGIERALSETFNTYEEAQEVLSECSSGCSILEYTEEDEFNDELERHIEGWS